MPISALSLKFYNIRYFSFNFEKRHSYKNSIKSKFTSYLHAFTRFRPAKVFDIRYVYRFASTLYTPTVKLNDILVNSEPQLRTAVE